MWILGFEPMSSQEQTVLLPADSSLRPSTPSIGIFIIIFPEIEKKHSWNSYGAMWLSLLGSCWGGGGLEPAGHRDWLRRQVIRGHLESTSVLSASHSRHSCCSWTLTGERQLTLWGKGTCWLQQHTGLMLKILTNANNSIIKHNLMSLT